MVKILGIESSCDETAVAIIDDNKQILAHNIASQIKEHAKWGGVVPEIALRAHADIIDKIILQTLKDAGLDNFNQLDAIAVTKGPGLIGGLIVGVVAAKTIASIHKLPIIGVNHLEGHALTAKFTDNVEFPFLLFLLSGGHCQILIVKNVGEYELLGQTLDDALGEAFDKCAKMLGLEYPGGPKVEQRAKNGDKNKYTFPRSMKGNKELVFSFSGIKTAVRRQIEQIIENNGSLLEQDINDICASFQECAAEILEDRANLAIKYAIEKYPNLKQFVISGGVAANKYIYAKLENICKSYNIECIAPPINLCTDNGVMIAWAGMERFKLGMIDNLEFETKARLSLVK